MYTYLIVLLVSFFLIAYFLKVLKKPFHLLAESSLSVVDGLISKLEEEEKVKLVQKHTSRLVVSFFKSFAVVIASICIGLIPLFCYTFFLKISFGNLDFTSFNSIISISIGSTFGFIVPVKQKKKSSYSSLSQLLHRMALNNYNIAYKLFKTETKKIQKLKLSENKKFVIVSGLARSGTTSLMNKLAENNHFASLSYANMPFVTSPNLWRKIYKPKKGKQKERSHQDGIKIGLDSNEALEEYFFKVLAQDSYIKENSIERYSVSEKDYSDYIKYQTIIKRNNEKLYLAKNNNFILRYSSIRKLNSEFLMIIMFREPMTHASSLLEKHKHYTSLQEEDCFVLEYMNWLGHHEFGKNQKPFQFNDSVESYLEDKGSIDYWLQIWINYYSYVLTLEKQNLLVINYEAYCNSPNNVLDNIYEAIGVKKHASDATAFRNNRKTETTCSEQLMQKAQHLYNELKRVATNS